MESAVKYVTRNFVPGRTFRDLEDFNAEWLAWLSEVSDVRLHGTAHQRPIDRFPLEAANLVPTAAQASFFEAMVRERVVAEDRLVAIDGNRYSVPCRLIGKTVQVVREGAHWVIRHGGRQVARHEVLAGKARLSVDKAHGPRAATAASPVTLPTLVDDSPARQRP